MISSFLNFPNTRLPWDTSAMRGKCDSDIWSQRQGHWSQQHLQCCWGVMSLTLSAEAGERLGENSKGVFSLGCSPQTLWHPAQGQ